MLRSWSDQARLTCLISTTPDQPRAQRVVARASTLILGLCKSDWDLIAAGLQDRLHQPPRAPLYPRSAALLEKAPKLGALGATLSGAGPSVLVWCHFEHTGTVIELVEREVRGWARAQRVTFETQGAYVRGL